MAKNKNSLNKCIWTIRSTIVAINLGIILGVLFKNDILPSSALSPIAGFAAALFSSLFIGPITNWASSGWETKMPLRADNGEPVDLLSKPTDIPGPFIIGILEVSIFYASLLLGVWEIIGVWLAFKAASKWAAWQHIMRLPESLEELENISYLQYRYARSSSLLSSFLIGTLSGVGAAFIGILVKRILN